jgi:hypothetical protein
VLRLTVTDYVIFYMMQVKSLIVLKIMFTIFHITKDVIFDVTIYSY